jgi:DNA repair protein RadC
MENTLTIRDWSPEERPREKLIEKGSQSLDSAELLAILIGSGTAKKSALDLGRELIYHFGSIDNLARASIRDLMQIKGIGAARAVSIASAFELCRRRETQCSRVIQAHSSRDVANYFRARLIDLKHEEFWVVYLNLEGDIIAEKKQSVGGRKSTTIDAQIVLGEGYNLSAHSFIMLHNHPSGTLKPSPSDYTVTYRIRDAAEAFNMPLRDHIIVARSGYFSFLEEGCFKKVWDAGTLSA